MKLTHTTPAEVLKILDAANKIKDFDDKARNRLRIFEDNLFNTYVYHSLFIGDENPSDAKKLLLYGTIPFTTNYNTQFSAIQQVWDCAKCIECGEKVVSRHAMGTGNLQPEIMIIGEAPGVADGEKKLERVMGYGPTSIFLRKALLHNKLLFKCWFTNLLKCSLPGNKKTSDEPFDNCLKNLEIELVVLEPKKILLLGKNVQNYVESKKEFYEKIKDKVYNIYHPSYCLYKGIDYKTYGNKIKEVLCQQ